MALRRTLLSRASNHHSFACLLCSALNNPSTQNSSNLSKYPSLELAMKLLREPLLPKTQGHDMSSLKTFVRNITFSDVSSLHLDLDPNFHKSVYSCASLLDILTKHGIACHVPKLICFMILHCVEDAEFLFVIDFSCKFKSLLTPSCYKVLFDSLARTSLLYGMKRVYTEMLEVVSPGVVTFNSMVNVYCSHGYVLESKQYVCKMIQSGLAPNLSTFTSLIMGYSRTKDVDTALRVCHKNMVEYGCAPDLKCYEHLIMGFCFAKKLGIARRLLDQMQRDGIAPSWKVFDKIVQCCCKLKNYGEAAQVVDHMITSGYSPELKDCKTLICGLYEEGEKERANAVFHKLLECGDYYDDEIAWTILIGGVLRKKGLAHEFSQLFQAMQKSGCHFSPQTHFMLNQALQRKT